MDGGAWWAAVHGVSKSQTQLSDFTFTFHFHALQKEMATHSNVLAWRIPGMVELGGLPSMGSHRVRLDWSKLAAAAAKTSLVTLIFFSSCNYFPHTSVIYFLWPLQIFFWLGNLVIYLVFAFCLFLPKIQLLDLFVVLWFFNSFSPNLLISAFIFINSFLLFPFRVFGLFFFPISWVAYLALLICCYFLIYLFKVINL